MEAKKIVDALRQGLIEEMEQDERVVLLGEDIAVFGGAYRVTQGLLEIFGEERVRDTPISEVAIIGAALGAAMTGLRPVAECQFNDFIACGMDQLCNQAAKMRSMMGGQVSVPMVLRAPVGATGRAAQHSQSLEAWFAHCPGLKVVMPSIPYDAKGLLISAVRDDNPVVFLEHKLLYGGSSPGGQGQNSSRRPRRRLYPRSGRKLHHSSRKGRCKTGRYRCNNSRYEFYGPQGAGRRGGFGTGGRCVGRSGRSAEPGPP